MRLQILTGKYSLTIFITENKMEKFIKELNKMYYKLNNETLKYDPDISGEDDMLNKIDLALAHLSIARQELEQGLKYLNNPK